MRLVYEGWDEMPVSDILFDNDRDGKQPRGGAACDISNLNVMHMELMGFWLK